jgi:5-methylcytosine-specific restriction endonuclease McrA
MIREINRRRLNDGVLVLNRSWLAVNVANVRRAVCLVALGHAQVVDPESFATHDFRGWVERSAERAAEALRGIGFSFRIPEIIVLTRYNGRQSRGLKLSRRNVIERDEGTCQYCGRRAETGKLTIDHVVPRSRGGQTCWENVVAACTACNDAKGDRTPDEAGMRLLREPRRPRWASTISARLAGRGKTSWERFLAGTPGGGVIVA